MAFQPHHVEHLNARAIDIDLAERLGDKSIMDRAELPDGSPDYWNPPGILYAWPEPGTGVTKWQFRPDSTTGGKYLSGRGEDAPKLAVIREGDGPLIICEGAQQARAVASYAPTGYAVYATPGAWNFRTDGVPTPLLSVTDGRDILILLDADAASNAEVYRAGISLAEACALEGAESIRFLRIPGAGKAGIDDLLGKRPEKGRAEYLSRLLGKTYKKPADKKPNEKGRRDNQDVARREGDSRPLIMVDGDPLDIIDGVTDALKRKFDGIEVFALGDVLVRLIRAERTEAIERGSFNDLVARSALTMRTSAKGTLTHAWPGSNEMTAALSRVSEYTSLVKLARSPIVRADGSVRVESGYDKATGIYLIPDAEREKVQVSEYPTAEDVERAKEILADFLADFCFPSETDRTHVVALMITILIRGLLPVVPMCVIDGLQMGSGKGLLAECICRIVLGTELRMSVLTLNDEEQRKALTAALLSGQDVILFDESPVIAGKYLAALLTLPVWEDRILGISRMAHIPNKVTVVGIGNQVETKGDLVRRVYQISLKPEMENPHLRPPSDFRHPDLKGWVAEHRTELLGAVLTLIRSWFVAGSPPPPDTGVGLGSFYRWQRTVGGILAHAGMGGFLETTQEWSGEGDYTETFWCEHFRWLAETFPRGKAFTTADVIRTAEDDGSPFGESVLTALPPGMTDDFERLFRASSWADRQGRDAARRGAQADVARKLGMLYRRQVGRTRAGIRLSRAGTAHRAVSKWKVTDSGRATPEGDDRSAGGSSPTVEGVRTDTPSTLSAALPAETDRLEGVEGVEGVGDTLTHGKSRVCECDTQHTCMCFIYKGGGSTPSTPSTPSSRGGISSPFQPGRE